MDTINPYIKVGYTVDDKPEFKKVRDFIVSEGYSTENFDHNMKSLMFGQKPSASKFAGFCEYDPFLNRINGEAEGDNFIHELLHMASNIEDRRYEIGTMCIDGTGESLNEGMTEYLTMLVTQNSQDSYPFEVYYFGFLTEMFFELRKKMIAKYFEGDPIEFYKLFGEKRKVVIQSVRQLDKFTAEIKQRAAEYDGESLYMNPSDTMKDHLVNAFAILIKDFLVTNRSYAIDLLADFEDEIYTKFDPDTAGEMVALFEDRIEIDKEL